MKIDVICSDRNHPVWPRLEQWCARQGATHAVRLIEKVADAGGGDLLFLVSCHEIVRAGVRANYRAALVIHASDLPQGRGWSPLIWQVLEGRRELVVTILEAADKVDDGFVWARERIALAGHLLFDELNALLFTAELKLMDFAVAHFGAIQPQAQSGAATYYRKRTPEDSRLDPALSLAEQFDLLRVADPDRYPAFFDHRGHRYRVRLDKMDPPGKGA